jgi:Zn-finger nucleic acid-binding protein
MGVLWSCEAGHGRAVTFPLLRRHVNRAFMNRLWQDIRQVSSGLALKGKSCPSCRKPMAAVMVDGVGDAFELDGCPICHFLWFDSEETLQLPILPREARTEELSLESKEAIAKIKVALLHERSERESFVGAWRAHEWWISGAQTIVHAVALLIKRLFIR